MSAPGKALSLDRISWIKPKNRILCITTTALFSHEQQIKTQISCQWRIVRLVITEEQILFYKHEEEFKVTTLMDVEETSITSSSLSRDYLRPDQVKAIRIEHSGLVNVIQGLKLTFHEPPIRGAPILLQSLDFIEEEVDPMQAQGFEFRKKKEQAEIPTLFLSMSSDEEAYRVMRALKLSQSWQRYKRFCISKKIEPNQQVLNWVQLSVEDDTLPFPVRLDFFSKDSLELSIEGLSQFLLQSSAINNLLFERDYLNDAFLMQDKHLMANLQYDAIYNLSLIRCNLNSKILSEIVDIICSDCRLVEIKLCENNLTDDSLIHIERIVENCTLLRSIDLSKNQLTGKKEFFQHFFDTINILYDEEIDWVDGFGFKLNLSQNRIGDEIVEVIESHVLFSVQPSITNIDLSFNIINKYNLWRLYRGYLKSISPLSDTDQKLVLNIFPLPFHPDIVRESILAFNKMDTDRERQKIIQQQREIVDRSSSNLQSINLSQSAVRTQRTMMASTPFTFNRNSVDISIQRLRYSGTNKPFPNKRIYIEQLKIYRDRVSNTLQDRETTIETLLLLAEEISLLEFEYPLALLDDFQELVWYRLCESLLIRDQYSVCVLARTGQLIGLEMDFFKKYLFLADQRKNSLANRIEKFLNFENLPESQMNDELGFLVKECIRLDMRGPSVDFLFLIKEKRDEWIRKQIETGFSHEIDLITGKGARGDCFSQLTTMEERKKVPKNVFSIQINGNFFSHSARADYVLLSRLSQKALLTSDERIENILEHYEENYFTDLAYRRIQFFLEDFEDLDVGTPFSLFLKIFQEGLRDLKLACARLTIQHSNFQHRRISQMLQLYEPKEPLSARSEEIIYPSDSIHYSQQYLITNFMYLRKFDFYFSKSEIALNSLLPIDMFHDKLEETFVKPLVQFPVPDAQTDIEQAMFKLINCVVISNAPNAHKAIPPVLQVLISIMLESKFQPHLRDEVYLQIVKYISKPDMTDSTEVNIISFLTILLIYVPPSDELNHFMRVILFKYSAKQRFARVAQEAFIALQTAAIGDAVLPDWIPSVFEIENRMQGFKNFSLRINFPNSTFEEFSITPFSTVGTLMKKIYEESAYFSSNAITDKFHYWIYEQTGTGEEEVALIFEEIIMEVMSRWDQSKFERNSLYLKRRIYQPYHTFRLNEIHQVQMSCLLDEQLRYFYSTANYAKSIPIPSVIRIAAYFLCILVKKRIGTKIDAKFVQTHIDLIIPRFLTFNKEEVATVINRMIQLERIDQFELHFLRYNILVQLRVHSFYCANVFEAKLNDSTRENTVFTVSAYCMNIFNKANLLKPIQTIFYEEIVSIVSITPIMVILQSFNKDSNEFSQKKITLSKPRAFEFVQDVISYAFLRMKDNNWALYAYSEFAKIQYRHSLLMAPQEIGLVELTESFGMIVNSGLNSIDAAETKEKVELLRSHISKTQYIIPEVTDYPYYRETTHYSLKYASRSMRRASYSESQLQIWFNNVLMDRQKESEKLQQQQATQNQASQPHKDRISAYDSKIADPEQLKNKSDDLQKNNKPDDKPTQQQPSSQVPNKLASDATKPDQNSLSKNDPNTLAQPKQLDNTGVSRSTGSIPQESQNNNSKDQSKNQQSMQDLSQKSETQQTNQKLNFKLFDAIKKRPGSKSPPPTQSASQLSKMPSLPQPNQDIQNTSSINNKQPPLQSSLKVPTPAEELTPEDQPILRHSRTSSRENTQQQQQQQQQKSISPSQSKERLRSMSRNQQTIHALSKKHKRSNSGSEQSISVPHSQQGQPTGSNQQTIPDAMNVSIQGVNNGQQEIDANSIIMQPQTPVRKPPTFLKKKA